MLVYVLFGACALLLITLVIAVIIIRGTIISKSADLNEYTIVSLTGRDIERIRQKLVYIGPQAVSSYDILNLIYVIRSIQLGTYSDENPYIPANPYDGFETLDEFDDNVNRI